MLELYGVRNPERDALLRSAGDARTREDREADVSVAVTDYARMESRAWKVEEFQDSVVPGLLQTPDNAGAVLRAWNPGATPRWMEHTLAARMARQRRLTDDDLLQLLAVIGEEALRRPVGGKEVMRAQLRHLVDVSALSNVELRVLPTAVGAHAAMSGAFIVLRFRDDQDVATTHSRGGDIYFEDVEPFAQTLRRLLAAALSQRKSVAMIAAIRREMDMSTRPTHGSELSDLRGASWHTSSYSQSANDCVETAFLPDGGVALRHSKHPDGSVLIYTRREWDAFLKGAKDGEFDASRA